MRNENPTWKEWMNKKTFFSVDVLEAFSLGNEMAENYIKTKNFGQFKFRTSVSPKFRRLITQARTPMVGKGYQKSASHM